MIKTKDLVPTVYTKMSRDFQLMGHIYDVVFNYLKTNINSMNQLPLMQESDSRLLELLCCTLGFDTTHQYDEDQLAKLCSIFIQIMKNKGSLHSIDLTLAMLCNLAGSSDEAYVAQDDNSPWELYIFVPSKVTNFVLLRDVLNYVIPSGVTYRIISSEIIKQNIETIIKNIDSVKFYTHTLDYSKSMVLSTEMISKLKEHDTEYFENEYTDSTSKIKYYETNALNDAIKTRGKEE